ncbi:MAG: hypothetical protein IPF99_43570 [Deltaproteobacteria bacterium]|nr:hypothetical protein [Deltaproteobacteria bacterium]
MFLGASERCNGVDDDCDGTVDGVAAMLACASGGSGRICAGGACACETPGRVFCGGTCRDLATDSANCGSCGNACGPMSRCAAGRCECVTGATACSGACVNLATDPTHCGDCTTTCPAGSNCTGGACVCTGTATLCGGRCVELLMDRTNCGACGRACSTSLICRAGACQCDVGRTLCGSACVDLSADRANCGRCGGACGPAAACVGGACACSSAGLTWCAGSCSSIADDTANCGRCGNVCRTGEMCLAGVCSVPVIEGPACEMAPTRVNSRIVFEGLTGARDFVFDGRGGVAVAQGSTVVMRRGSDSTPVTMVMPGEVVALRYTRTAGLMLAVFNNTGMGTSNGAIYQVAPGATTATVRQGGLRQPGGLAVDANNNVWFSDLGPDRRRHALRAHLPDARGGRRRGGPGGGHRRAQPDAAARRRGGALPLRGPLGHQHRHAGRAGPGRRRGHRRRDGVRGRVQPRVGPRAGRVRQRVRGRRDRRPHLAPAHPRGRLGAGGDRRARPALADVRRGRLPSARASSTRSLPWTAPCARPTWWSVACPWWYRRRELSPWGVSVLRGPGPLQAAQAATRETRGGGGPGGRGRGRAPGTTRSQHSARSSFGATLSDHA